MGSCEEIQILISKFVDDEVTDEERARVESHVATCEACSIVMLQYVEMAALFAETPVRQPEPELRASLFREIGNVNATASKQRSTGKALTPWFIPEKGKPAPVAPALAPLPSLTNRLIHAASPLMMAAVPIVFILGALILSGKWVAAPEKSNATAPSGLVPIQPIPTYEAPIAQGTSDIDGVPPAALTKAPGVSVPPPLVGTVTYMSATATLGPYQVIQLAQATPVYEDGDATSKTGWHSMRDANYGYKLSYPSNWWTRTLNNVRYFYPWGPGGTDFAPYWVQMTVEANDKGLTAATANEILCGGGCDSVNNVWLKRSRQDDTDFYHEGYLFDANYIYKLQLVVPVSLIDGLGSLQDRIAAGDQIFGTMSGRVVLAGSTPQGESTFGGFLFLKGVNPDQGSDIYLASESSENTRRITSNGGVKNYALSPDMESVLYAATDKGHAGNAWAKYIYLVNIAPSTDDAPNPPLATMDTIHDIAWYSDHELIFLAENAGALGLYKIDLSGAGTSPGQKHMPGKPVLLVSLGGGLSGARSLAVSPDRQLITFIAPLRENGTSDIYGVRPDGSDLHVIISHASVSAPAINGTLVLAEGSQAIKSYQWIDGHLESDGYKANILFTCGNSYSPSSILGGYLFSAPRSTRDPAMDPFTLVTYTPEKLQIIQVAYSSWDKVAFTGYYQDLNGRSDKLEGLWEANILPGGTLSTAVRLPIPGDNHGITDLQWTPDGAALIYRETIVNSNNQSARYDGESAFRMVRLDPSNGHTDTLYNNEP